MTLLNRIAHGATGLWAYRQKRQFIRDSHHCRHLQEQRLAQILSTAAPAPAHQAGNLRPDMDWQAFAERVPVTDYLSWEPWIERQLQDQPGKLSSSPIVRHQPTSGSTSAVKWIPYTRQFLQVSHPVFCNQFACQQGGPAVQSAARVPLSPIPPLFHWTPCIVSSKCSTDLSTLLACVPLADSTSVAQSLSCQQGT